MKKPIQPNLAIAQRGIATVLTVILVGFALIVSLLGTAYYLRMKQQADIASHAVTNAQQGAWVGVEAVRSYFTKLSSTEVAALAAGDLTVSGLTGTVTAHIDSVTAPATATDPYKVVVTVSNTSATSKAASKVKVVYNVTPSASGSGSSGTGSGGSGTNLSVMNIYSNLDANGGITVTQNGTNTSEVNVDGTFTAGSVSLTGINKLSVTGDVRLGSAVQIPYVYTNGNLTLTQGGAVTNTASAKGWIHADGGGSNGDLYADKNITLDNTTTRTLNTLDTITLTSWPTVTTLTAGGAISIAGGKLGTVLSKSSVGITGSASIEKITSEATVTCPANWWTASTAMRAVSFSNCNMSKATTVAAGTNNLVTTTGALTTVSLTGKPIVNALSYTNNANYTFDTVAGTSKIQVTVKSVNGITDGVYYLGKKSSDAFQGSSQTYLCASVDANSVCTSAIVGKMGEPDWNYRVITYSGGTWTLTDNNQSNNATLGSLPPGVLLFKGNLNASTGKYKNTLLATGNIDYGTSIVLEAPNYAGASVVCGNTRYPRPTNLCSSSISLIPASIGNIALLAGSCTDATTVNSCQSTYTGGNISLISSATVYGNVIAGNNLNTSGNTQVIGSLLAAGLGTPGVNTFANSTTIDLSTLQNHLDFSTDPGVSSSNSGSTSTGAGTTTAIVKWARYL